MGFLLLVLVWFWDLSLRFSLIFFYHHQIFKLRFIAWILILKLWKRLYFLLDIYFWIWDFLNVSILYCLYRLLLCFFLLFIEENSLTNTISHTLFLFCFLGYIFFYFRWTIKSLLFLLTYGVKFWQQTCWSIYFKVSIRL